MNGSVDTVARRKIIKLFLLGLISSTMSACKTPKNNEVIKRDLTEKKILVIGAGVSGLTAGKELKRRGAEVVVLEAQNRIGGRLFTDRSLGFPFEIGAGWIHGSEGNPIVELVNNISENTFVTDDNSLILFDVHGERVSDFDVDKLDREYKALLQSIDKDLEDKNISLSEAFIDAHSDEFEKDVIQWALTAFTEFDTGGAIEKLSAYYFDEDINFGGLDVILPNGYDAILAPLSEGLEIKLNHIVNDIAYDETSVTVTTDKGVFYGDYVVVSLPLGVLKQKNPTFTPKLPNFIQNAIDKIPMGNVTKVALVYEDAFWSEDTQYFGYMSEKKGKFPYFLNSKTFSKTNALIGLCFGNYANEIEKKSDEEIQIEISSILQVMFGSSIPEPKSIVVTRWSTDPYSYGAYSYTGVGVIPNDFNILSTPINKRLFLTGEHTLFNYHGTVHGAYLSGLEVAKKIKYL